MCEKYSSPENAARQFSLEMARYRQETERAELIGELFPEGVGLYRVEDAVARVLKHSPQLRPEEVQEFRYAIARRKKVAERDELIGKLFPEGIGPYDVEKVVVRICEHFPQLDRKEIRQMNPGDLAAYLERVVEKEGAHTTLRKDLVDTPPNDLLAGLTKDQQKILRYLWQHLQATLSDLHANV